MPDEEVLDGGNREAQDHFDGAEDEGLGLRSATRSGREVARDADNARWHDGRRLHFSCVPNGKDRDCAEHRHECGTGHLSESDTQILLRYCPSAEGSCRQSECEPVCERPSDRCTPDQTDETESVDTADRESCVDSGIIVPFPTQDSRGAGEGVVCLYRGRRQSVKLSLRSS